MEKLLNINQIVIGLESARDLPVQLYTVHGEILFHKEKVETDIVIDTSSYKEDIYILQIGSKIRGVHIY